MIAIFKKENMIHLIGIAWPVIICLAGLMKLTAGGCKCC